MKASFRQLPSSSFILPTSSLLLERKERFELSKRVWKTRMFPATSLPREIWNSWQDSNPQHRRSKRRTLPIELQEREEFRISDCELRRENCEFQFRISNSRILKSGAKPSL